MGNLSAGTTLKFRTKPAPLPVNMATRPGRPSFAQRNPSAFSWLLQLQEHK